jgi:hypothetical protein
MSSRLRVNVPVKPHRNSPRTPGRFGKGILGTCPGYRLPCTISDLDWAARAFAEDTREDREAARFSVLADEAAGLDWAEMRMERGLAF